MKTSRNLLTAFLAVFVLTATALAADPTGQWKWTSVTKTGGPSEVVAALVVKDGVLTGTVTGRQGPAEISEASLKGDVVAFSVTRSSGNMTVVFKYSGQVSGDTLTGTIEKTSTGGAAPTKTDWKATRGK
jgi:hypothetical protein